MVVTTVVVLAVVASNVSFSRTATLPPNAHATANRGVHAHTDSHMRAHIHTSLVSHRCIQNIFTDANTHSHTRRGPFTTI